MKQRKEEHARQVLTRLLGSAEADREIRNIQQVLAEVHEDVSLSALVRSRSLRRPLVIGCLLMLLGPLSGINAIMYYAPKIFQTAGLASTEPTVRPSSLESSISSLPFWRCYGLTASVAGP